jgi:hypothetical protein
VAVASGKIQFHADPMKRTKKPIYLAGGGRESRTSVQILSFCTPTQRFAQRVRACLAFSYGIFVCVPVTENKTAFLAS